MKKLLVLFITFPFLFFSFICSAQFSVSILAQGVHCYGQSNGNAVATPSGGTAPYTYHWLPGGQNTQGIGGLSAATYTVNVKDHAGLTASATATVTQPSTLIASVSAKYGSVCPGASDSLYASGTGGTVPYNYMWSGPIGDVSCVNCQNTSVYPYGAAYVVTAINDMNGCSASASVMVTVRPFPYVSVQGPLSPVLASHNDTLIALSPGASSYLWSNGNTHSSIIVSPAVTTTYSVKTTNTYGCYDTARYIVSPNSSGSGSSSGTAISVSPNTNVTNTSYSTTDSVVWFSFVAANSNTQIIAYGNYLGMPIPHVHRLSLYDSSLHTLVDEPMPDIIGANQIRIDASNLAVGHKYYVRASRCPAHANMAGCNPSTHGECNPTQRWDFQMCFRTVPVFVPDDSDGEAPAVSQLYYEHRGQITDLNGIPRFDVKAYTNNAKPAVFCTDSAVAFVYQHIDTAQSFIDTFQRVDMVLTGTSVEPSEPVFKMQEDSNAGYLNYFLRHVPNGVPKIEGYSRLVYKNVYPNVDMQIFSNNVGTKIYFICAPAGSGVGAGNPANIELQFKGASSVNVNGSGGLDVVTELGTLTFASGFAYTDSAGIVKPKSWHANFVVVNSNTVRFNTGSFNSSEPLVIEIDRGHQALNNQTPIGNLDWSTYFGGTDWQSTFNGICADKRGNVYGTGYTQSLHYPVTTGVVQDTIYNNDANNLNATVAKFDTLDARIWATYYGGDYYTIGSAIAVDAAENVYITGTTVSSNMPLASAPSSPNNYVQSFLNGVLGDNTEYDAFITMFSSDGTKTYWATYYGSIRASEWGYDIAIDRDTNIYVVGGKANAAPYNNFFPLQKSSKAGAYYDTAYGKGFIMEFNATHAFNPSVGIQRIWATRIGDSILGDTSNAALFGCTVDASNNFYVTGQASGRGYVSPVHPTLPYQDDTSYVTSGVDNAVVTKFNSNNNVIWSSYFGGNVGECGNTITVDQSGNVYIAGISASDSSHGGVGIETKKLGSGFFQRFNGNSANGGEGFIAEFSSGGSLEWGTYFGGSNYLSINGIGVDAYNNLYVTGYDRATNMPLPISNPVGAYSQTSHVSGPTPYNAFVADFSNANISPDYIWGTYFGADQATGMCITHSNGNNWLYIVGNLGGGYTPQVYPAGSYQQPTFYYDTSGPIGTSFISQFDINPSVFAGINNIHASYEEIEVYPNPTQENVTVQVPLSQNQDVEFIVYNMTGAIVYNKKISEPSGTINQVIDMGSLPNGIYLIRVNANNKYMSQKIIKQY